MSGRHEVPDQTPVEMPAGWVRPVSLQEEIARLIRSELQRAGVEEVEEWEEADDFDVDDEELPYSPHELSDLEGDAPREALKKLLTEAEKARIVKGAGERAGVNNGGQDEGSSKVGEKGAPGAPGVGKGSNDGAAASKAAGSEAAENDSK